MTIDFHNLPKGVRADSVDARNIKWDFSNRAKSISFFEYLDNLFDFNSVHDFCFCTTTCINAIHWSNIEYVWSNFIKSVTQAGYATFGSVKVEHKAIPGWNAHVKELHGAARDAFRHWRRCGSPRHGDDAMAMRRSRAAFKHAIRRCRQEEEAMRAEAMSQKLASGDSRAFWRAVGASGGGGAVRPDRIDGAVGSEDVAGLWATKFGGVLNSVQDEAMKRQYFRTHAVTTESEIPPVTVAEITTIIRKLKLGKSIGLDGIPNEFYRNCNQNNLVFISMMCNAFIIHEFMPENVTQGKIIPLIKGKLLDISLSDSYRPITICTSISKIIEHLLYNRISGQLGCEDNQFGYKENSSTDQCIFTLKAIVDHYTTASGRQCSPATWT